MKLQNKIFMRLSLALLAVLSIWAVVFYYTMLAEVYDEVDDQLEVYAQQIIRRQMVGVTPITNDASNNTYSIRAIDIHEIDFDDYPRYSEKMMMIDEKEETEPARILETYFCDNENNYFLLTIVTPILETHDLREAIWIWIIVLYFMLLIAILVINLIVYKRSFKPLYTLFKWLDNYTISNHSRLNLKTNITEFRELNRVVSDSLLRAEVAYSQQQMFVANASHEMQTPIAIVTNNVDLLTQTDMNEEQLGIINNIQRTLKRASATNRALLIFAKIQNDVYVVREKVNVSYIINDILANLTDIYSYKNIEISSDIEEFYLNTNGDLIEILVANLLKNAMNYVPKGGRVSVVANEKEFVVSNTSVDNVELDVNLIFQPFYKSASSSFSSGIGLALVKSISDELNLTLQYKFENNLHIFKVSDSFQK